MQGNERDCSPPGYSPSRLLILVNWSVSWFACVRRITYPVCRRPAPQLHFLSQAAVANVTRTQLCEVGLDLAQKLVAMATSLGAVSTFHDDNICETRFSTLCASCLELTTDNCSQQ